ncbi:MAG TPA: hypothetical protein VFG20_16035 [Planctomycetaceae bacterium]|nr:hypothetical protein [Planctomycetaceae bacterium]
MATGSLISFRSAPADFDSLSDAEFLQSLVWTRTAPKELVDAARLGQPARFLRVWRTRVKELRRGGSPKALQSLWSLPTVTDPGLEQALAPLRPNKSRSPSRRTAIHPKASWTERIAPLANWLTVAEHWAEAVPAILVCGLELLATSAAALPVETLWPLFRRVLTAALQHRTSPALIGAPPDVLLQHQGEIPYCAGLLFIDVLGATEVLRRGQKALQKELPARADNDGTVHAEIAGRLPLWLAPLLRCTAWAEAFQAELWDVDDRALLNDVCERTLALCRADGRLALTNGLAVDPLPVLSSAAELFRWTSTNPSLSCLKNLHRHAAGEKAARPLLGGGLVMPSNQSDWARFAVLRSDWSATADTVAVAHHEPLPQLDVTISGQPLIHGPWGMQLRIGETQIELAEEWSCVCWETDPEADYVELQMCGPGKLRVERLILLSRTDQFLFLADSISGVKNERIEYSAELPLVPGLTASTETETRLWQLRSPRSRVRVIPLGLPAERVHSTPHDFTISDRAIQMRHIGVGRGLLAPVVFDWHPKRRTAPVDWKPLTVTEESKILRPDQAAGYRLRIGAAQWLFYRSLQSTGMSRAVLGHHTFNETVIARFDKQGDTEPLLMIAGPE